MFVGYGTDLKAQINDGSTLSDLAVQQEQVDIICMLIEKHDAESNGTACTSFCLIFDVHM